MIVSDTQYPHFPNINVILDGTFQNVTNLMFKVASEMEKNSVPNNEIRKFIRESTQKDYVNLLQVCMCWVNIV